MVVVAVEAIRHLDMTAAAQVVTIKSALGGIIKPIFIFMSKTIILIAMMCHAANKAWCEANGDPSQKSWEEADEWQKSSAIKCVQYRLDNPYAAKDAQHNAWMKDKVENGWVYGPVKDVDKKTHPCIVEYKDLPEVDQKKDAIFIAIVDALKPKSETLSFGEKAVGIDFNVSGSGQVDSIKTKFANIINEMDYYREAAGRGEKARYFSKAISSAEDAQMNAVKGATWRY
jgi:hypothetical protein